MKALIQVPRHFHRRIVGKRGCVVSSIEKRNRVIISVPKPGEKCEVITICGENANIDGAKREIFKIVQILETAVKEARSSSRLAALDKAVNGRKIKAKFDYSSKDGLHVMLLVCCLSHPSNYKHTFLILFDLMFCATPVQLLLCKGPFCFFAVTEEIPHLALSLLHQEGFNLRWNIAKKKFPGW